MNNKLDIPFYNQLSDMVPKEYQRQACAIISLKMLIEYFGQKIDFLDLQNEGLFIKGKENAGWNHEAIVRILRNHGILAYRQEFLAHIINLENKTSSISNYTSLFIQNGIEKIKTNINNELPVLASFVSGFSQDLDKKISFNLEHHMVLISGFDEKGFFINDPLIPNGKDFFIDFEHFIKYWRKFCIFVEKANLTL
jgi:uncharacterized protein YvpB